MDTVEDTSKISIAIHSDLTDVDLSQLQRNLSLTIEERLIEHQNSLDLVFDLQDAGKMLREKSQ